MTPRPQPAPDPGSDPVSDPAPASIEASAQAPPPTSQAVRGRTGDDGPLTEWQLPVEALAALRINDHDHAVVLCTPADLADLGYGFALSEGIVSAPQAIRALRVAQVSAGYRLDLEIAPAALARQQLRQRRYAAHSGCGLCGVQSLEGALRPLPPLRRAHPVSTQAITRAFTDLPAHQPIKRCNHSVHAAAWCAADGAIRLVREDVGRHNALDKLIGALARHAIDPTTGFVVMSSRCSVELVQKVVTAGIGTLATLSAPTTLALQLARQSGLQLAARCATGVITFHPTG